MPGYIYNEFKKRMAEANYNLASGGDTLRMALVGAGYTPDIDTHATYADISANECAGDGYTAGGKAITGQAVTKDTVNDRMVFDADDVAWTGLGPLTPQPAFAVLYDDTHVDNPLIAYWPVSTLTNGGDWTLVFDATAVLLLT